MKSIKILDWTMKDPLNCIGMCAGICWGSDTSVTKKNVKRALSCIDAQHGRVEELPDVYVVIDGYSAKCIRELYTHIGGAPTRLQASTRYIDYTSTDMIDVVTPHTVERNQIAKIIWDTAIYNITKAMNDLKNLNIPNEDLTNLLPLAYCTEMVWKVNLRTLINFFNMRMCNRYLLIFFEVRKVWSILIFLTFTELRLKIRILCKCIKKEPNGSYIILLVELKRIELSTS